MKSQIEASEMLSRSLLETAPNPNAKRDYLTNLRKPITATLFVDLVYVPDKLLLLPEAYDAYLNTSMPRIVEPYEGFAHSFLEDVNNEIVPRWLRIEIKVEKASTRRIIVTDSQPNWSNPSLLASIL